MHKLVSLYACLGLIAMMWTPAQADPGEVGHASETVEVKASDQAPRSGRERGHCIGGTGTHIRRAKSLECERPGRRYTREELRRRGEIDLGEALFKSDPAIYGGKQW